jgi:hypothetical protein
MIMDFQTATAKLIDKRGHNRPTKKLKNNTYLTRIDSETIGVQLHNTIVVTIHSDGTYTLNSGGWQTVTTKQRINEYCPVRVSQRKHQWYVGDEEMPFKDGMRVTVKHGLEVAVV